MDHVDAAHAAAIVGAAGSALLLLLRLRSALVAGFALIAGAELGLAYALVPGDDLRLLVDTPARVGLVVVLALAVAGLGVALARFPAAVPVVVLLAAPFRVPVSLGAQEAFLLLPLYAVLAAAVLGLLLRALRGAELPGVPRALALPAAAFVGLSAVSLLWTKDLRAGTIELLFFLFPFVGLVVVVARGGREMMRPWLPKALVATLVALAGAFAAIGISQLWTEDLYLARDLEVANAYTSYFRTTSLFSDSSIYGRQLVVAIVVLVAALWLGRIGYRLGAALIALLWAGLYFSYSQSSMAALVVSVLALSLVAADRLGRRVLAVGTVVIAVAATALVVTTVRDHTAQRFTSGRSTLVESAWRVFVDHPAVGVGVGAQPKASKEARGGRRETEKNASHTTPLTVAAELGVVGLLAYLALLAGAARLLLAVVRRDRALGLGLASAFLLLLVHSLAYSGFFEDPTMWGILAVAAAAVSRAAMPAVASEGARLPAQAVAPGPATAAQ